MTEWVVAQTGRTSDMDPKISLRLERHLDGDIVLYIDHDGMPITDDAGNKASAEFCSSGSLSTHTRHALYALLEAVHRDAAERPEGIPEYPMSLHPAKKE